MPAPRDPVRYNQYIDRLRQSHLGYDMPESQKRSISRALTGRVFSDEHKRSLSKAIMGKPRPWMVGKPSRSAGKTWKMPDDAKEKIRQSQTGENNSMFGKPSWNKGLVGYITGPKNPRWRGGVSSYPSEFSWALREGVRKSSGRVCVLSLKRGNGRRLDVHHIDGDNQNNCPDNLIPLHLKIHKFLHDNEEFFEGTPYWKPNKGVGG